MMTYPIIFSNYIKTIKSKNLNNLLTRIKIKIKIKKAYLNGSEIYF